MLYYYTEMKKRDGKITDDELTPVVLKDGLVDGWTWSHWNDLVNEHGFGGPPPAPPVAESDPERSGEG